MPAYIAKERIENLLEHLFSTNFQVFKTCFDCLRAKLTKPKFKGA